MNVVDTIITIATDYSRYPGPRYEKDGPYSGEKFRDSLLLPKLREAITSGHRVFVVLDGVAGYGSSFLEESFGGLIRSGLLPADLRTHLSIVAKTSRFQHHLQSAQKYIAEAEARLSEAA